MAEENKSSLDPLSALCKRRGFIYHSSEIYGGMPGFWDYGPLGCELKQNVKQAWWQFTVRGRSDVAGLDATIIMHPLTKTVVLVPDPSWTVRRRISAIKILFIFSVSLRLRGSANSADLPANQ